MHASWNKMITITWCTKTSCPPSSGVMNPQPFATLNHLHRPRRVTPVTALPLAPAAPANNIQFTLWVSFHQRRARRPLACPLPALPWVPTVPCARAMLPSYLLRNLPSNWVFFLQLSSFTHEACVSGTLLLRRNDINRLLLTYFN